MRKVQDQLSLQSPQLQHHVTSANDLLTPLPLRKIRSAFSAQGSPRGSVDETGSASERKQTMKNSCESIGSLINRSVNPWSEFTQYVKSIDVDSMYFQQKRFNDKSSNDFQKVMSEIETDDQKVKRDNGVRKASNSSLYGEVSVLSVDSSCGAEPSAAKASMRDTVNRRKLSTSVMGAICKGRGRNVKPKVEVPETTDARQELYKKYIYEPNSWASGFSSKNYPKFLLEREQEGDKHRRGRPKTAAGHVKWSRPETRVVSGRNAPKKKGRPKSSFT